MTDLRAWHIEVCAAAVVGLGIGALLPLSHWLGFTVAAIGLALYVGTALAYAHARTRAKAGEMQAAVTARKAASEQAARNAPRATI